MYISLKQYDTRTHGSTTLIRIPTVRNVYVLDIVRIFIVAEMVRLFLSSPWNAETVKVNHTSCVSNVN